MVLWHKPPLDREVDNRLAKALDVLRLGRESRQVTEVKIRMLEEGARLNFGGAVQAPQGRRRQLVPPALPLHLRRLQAITQRHQFIYLGNDSMLFGERRDRKNKRGEALTGEMLDAGTGKVLGKPSVISAHPQHLDKEVRIDRGRQPDPMNSFLKVNVLFALIPDRRATRLAAFADQHVSPAECEFGELRIFESHFEDI